MLVKRCGSNGVTNAYWHAYDGGGPHPYKANILGGKISILSVQASPSWIYKWAMFEKCGLIPTRSEYSLEGIPRIAARMHSRSGTN